MPDLLETIRDEADKARADPSLLPAFRALRLNMGVSDVLVNTLIDAGSWERVEADDLPDRAGPYALGMDLGDGAAMSAAAAYWPATGRLEAVAAFPEEPGLSDRGLRDGVGRLYLDMARRGELIVTAGQAVSVEALLGEVLARGGAGRPLSLRTATGRRTCARRSTGRTSRKRFSWRAARASEDGAEDVRAFRRAVLEDRVAPGRSLLLRAALSEARTVADPSANEKLAKGIRGRAAPAGARRCSCGCHPGRGGRHAPGQVSTPQAPLRGGRMSGRHARLNSHRWAAGAPCRLRARRAWRCVMCGRPGRLECGSHPRYATRAGPGPFRPQRAANAVPVLPHFEKTAAETGARGRRQSWPGVNWWPRCEADLRPGAQSIRCTVLRPRAQFATNRQ